jgi:hypothetical protein
MWIYNKYAFYQTTHDFTNHLTQGKETNNLYIMAAVCPSRDLVVMRGLRQLRNLRLQLHDPYPRTL